MQLAEFGAGPAGLDRVDWELLQSRDFKRDPEDPERFDRYQAEALVHRHLPCEALLGIACYREAQRSSVEGLLRQRGMQLKLLAQRDMFF